MANEILNILRLLIENKEKRYSIREISKLRRINYKTAYQSIMKLEKEEVIKLERLGNTTNCSFDNAFSPLVFHVEYLRRDLLLKKNDFKVIYSYLNEHISPFIALIFGSYAKNKASKHSDIDMIVISEKDILSDTISLIPKKIHLVTITPKEFIEMAKSKEFNVVNEAIKNNIILIGIEEYYRLMQNVR